MANNFQLFLLIRHQKAAMLIAFSLFYSVGFAANPDSLLRALQNCIGNKSRLEVLSKLYQHYENTNPDSALYFAETMIPVARNEGKKEEAWAYFKKGRALFNLGNYLSAEPEFYRAIRTIPSADASKLWAKSFNYLGDVFAWKTDNLTAIGYYRKAVAEYSSQNNPKNVLTINNKIANCFEAISRYDSAIFYLNKNIEARGKVDNNYAVLLSYQQIAFLYSKQHNYKKAYGYLLEGIDFAQKTDSRYSLAELYLSAARMFLDNSIYEDFVLRYLSESRKEFERVQSSNDIIKVDLCMADYYSATGGKSKALGLYREALNQVNPEEKYLVSYANYRLGVFYESLGKEDSADIYFETSIDQMCNVCPEISIHPSLLAAAKTSLQAKKYSKALSLLTRALGIAQKAHAGYEQTLTTEELANFYRKTARTDSAIGYYVQSYLQAKKLGLLEHSRKNAEALGQLYYSKANYKTASEFLTIANKISDSLSIANRSDELAKLELRMEVLKHDEEKQKETLLAQTEIKRQKFIRNYLIFGFLLSLFVAIFLLRAYRRKQKDNRLLAQQKDEIRDMAQQLHQTDNNKLLFYTNISHEIRTPLTLIKSPVEQLLKSTDKQSDTYAVLQTVLNNANKLHEITNQILDLRRIDEHQLNLHPETIDIVDLIKNMASSFEPYCNQMLCRFAFRSNTSSALMRVDKVKLQSIVSNLLSNAFKFNSKGGDVCLLVNIEGHRVSIVVTDTGRGIADEHLQKLGTRYYQINTPYLSEGSGIGLAYVKEITALMGGSFEISSTEGAGTKVLIEIEDAELSVLDAHPLVAEYKPHENLLDKLHELIEDDSLHGKPSLLIVEDNAELREFMLNIFGSAYKLITAKDGIEGRDLAFKHNPSLIISDIMMPGISGDALCQVLKSDLRTSHIPVILLTAKDSRQNQLDGYQCGADDYIVKPFDVELLTQKVKNILATRDSIRKQFVFGDVESNPTIQASDIDRTFLSKCLSLVNSNIDNPSFTVEFLAEEIGLSRKTLLRKFKSLTDKTPSDLIRHTRMSFAAQLLREKKLRVNEVALRVGYEDPDSFTSAFKQVYGVAPSAYGG